MDDPTSTPPAVSEVSHRDPTGSRDPDRPIAAFDFDGTITRRDTMMPFLRSLAGTRRLAASAIADLPRLALVGLRIGDREAAKARLLRRLLAGRDDRDVRAAGRAHAAAVLAREIRASARERVEWHRAREHELVIVSASLDVYLDVIGPELGFDEVVCTRLESRDGVMTGAMVGGNCRGQAKLTRLQSAYPRLAERELWAYGDSAGDRALLAAADHAFWMTDRGQLRAIH